MILAETDSKAHHPILPPLPLRESTDAPEGRDYGLPHPSFHTGNKSCCNVVPTTRTANQFSLAQEMLQEDRQEEDHGQDAHQDHHQDPEAGADRE